MHGISGVKEVVCSHICVDKNILSFQQCFFFLAVIVMLLAINDNWVS